MADVDLDALALLIGGEGQELLHALPAYDAPTELALQTRLRQAGFAPELVAAALAQSRLRARARAKFGDFADGMLFTAEGLEQATRLEVAARHASRFLRAEVRAVHDLGCGIGADAMAFASLDLGVQAVDSDAVTAVVAGYNLRHWPDAHVVHGLVEEVRLPEAGDDLRHTGLWLDPARRERGTGDMAGRARRVVSLDAISPSWSQVQALAARMPATGAKLSPALPHRALPPATEAQWTSWRGEVVECAVWWGPLVDTVGRTAAVCRPAAPAVVLTEADAWDAPPPVGGLADVGAYLYEADRAVIRAGLTGALARRVDGAELDHGVGYVTSERAVDVPWAHRYAVLAAMPWNVKAVRAWLRDHGVARMTIKKRGVPLDPEVVRRQLRTGGTKGGGTDGGEEAVLVLTRLAGHPHVLVVTPS